MTKHKIGQIIYGNGEWGEKFPKGAPYKIVKIIERNVKGNNKIGFNLENIPNDLCGDGWYESWFDKKMPEMPKMRVIRDDK